MRALRPLTTTVLLVLVSSDATAAPWEPATGDLGRPAHRVALHIGAMYGSLSGSEVSKADAGLGVDGGVSYRALSSVSVYVGAALHSSDVDGQLPQLLDVFVRADARSGHVVGTLDSQWFRGGIRVDAYRAEDWNYQVYFLAGALYSTVEANIDTVDGETPTSYFVQTEGGLVEIDPGTITSEEWGGFGRLGIEYLLGQRFAVDLNFTYDALGSRPGSVDLASIGAGAVFRF